MLGLLILMLIALIAIVLVLTTLIVREAQRPPRHTAGYALAKGMHSDPGERGLQFEEWMLDRGEGVKLPVWEINLPQQGGDPPSDGQPKAPLTIIFIHGWGHSKIDMLWRIEPWTEMADHFVFYDLRGHGEAEGSLSRLGHAEEEDLLALVERLGDRQFLLVGHSMGAVIAVYASLREGDSARRIKGIVAYGLYSDFHASLRGRLRRVGFPTRPLTDLAMAWFRLKGIRHRELIRDAHQLTCPILMVHGTHDDIAPMDQVRQFSELASDAVLHSVQDGGHLDAYDVDAETHAQIVREFVSKLT